MTRTKNNSHSAGVSDAAPRSARALACALVALACLAGCAGDPVPQAATPPGGSRGLVAELDALQHQPGPASDEVIASLERALREQREKRARAVVAAGTTAVIPSGSSAVGASGVQPQPATTAPAAPPALVAAAPAPAKPVHMTRAQARAASAAAVRQATAARQSAAATPAQAIVLAPNATALPPLHPAAQPVSMPLVRPTGEVAVVGPERTPMSRISESHLPVDELYARARQLELQAQVPEAIALYREASQRGHAPSSQRLMELYADGAPGVARDYRVAVFFKERAVQQGASFDPAWRR